MRLIFAVLALPGEKPPGCLNGTSPLWLFASNSAAQSRADANLQASGISPCPDRTAVGDG